MPILGITRDDFINSAWNALICSAPFFTGMSIAWTVNKIGSKILKIEGHHSSSDALRMKAFAFASGAAVSLALASHLPPLIPFTGKQILQFLWLTLLDTSGVIPGYFGQRSLFIIGCIGAFVGLFPKRLLSN